MKISKVLIPVLAIIGLGAFSLRILTPTDTAVAPVASEKKAKDGHAEQDEHGAPRIVITDVKLAAAGVVFAEAGAATLSDTLQFNGVLRANQEAVVQVTPRFPGIVRAIRKRIGDVVA